MEASVEEVVALWELDDSERATLVELLGRLNDINHPKKCPMEVVRYMRARPKSLDEAEEMFRNMITWRAKVGADSIIEEWDPPQQLVEKYLGAVLSEFDADGDPIYYERLGRTKVNALLKEHGRETLIKHGVWLREQVSRGPWIPKFEKARAERGRTEPVKRVTVITDLEGLGLSHATGGALPIYQELMRLDQDNYAETAKRILIIRAPLAFRIIWKLVANFFDPGVVAKITVAGSDMKDIEKFVPKKSLPTFLGGEATVIEGYTGHLEDSAASERK